MISFSEKYKKQTELRSNIKITIDNIMQLSLQPGKIFPNFQHEFENLLFFLDQISQFPSDLFTTDFFDVALSLLIKLKMQCSPLETFLFIFISKFALTNKEHAKYLYDKGFFDILMQYLDNKPEFLEISIISNAFSYLSSISSFVSYNLLENDRISGLFQLIPSLLGQGIDNKEIFDTILAILAIPEKISYLSLSHHNSLILLDLLLNVYDLCDNNNYISQINFSLINVLQQAPTIKYIAAEKILRTHILFQKMIDDEIDPLIFSTSLWLLNVILENDSKRTRFYINLDFMIGISNSMSNIGNELYQKRKWYDFYKLMANSDSLIEIFFLSQLSEISIEQLNVAHYNEIENIVLMYSHIFANSENVERSLTLLGNDLLMKSFLNIMQTSTSMMNIYNILVNLRKFLEKIIIIGQEIPSFYKRKKLKQILDKYKDQQDTYLYESANSLLDLFAAQEIKFIEEDENSDDDF